MLDTLNLKDLSNSLAGDVLTEALDIMAFISAEPADASIDAPAAALKISMPFRGPFSGVVEMVAAPGLGELLISNLLGPAADQSASGACAEDVLKELLNITCGLLFRKLAPSGDGFEISLPQLARRFDVEADWALLVNQPRVSLLDAEGNLVAICVKAGESA